LAQAEGEKSREIERAWMVRQDGLDPLKTKIHPRRKPEDAKFEDSRGFTTKAVV